MLNTFTVRSQLFCILCDRGDQIGLVLTDLPAPEDLLSPLDYHSRQIAMRVTVRHGINGDEELTTQAVAGVTVGWDLMEQMARKLALDSPFQIVLYLSCTAGTSLRCEPSVRRWRP